jgi:VWFA-related protein
MRRVQRRKSIAVACTTAAVALVCVLAARPGAAPQASSPTGAQAPPQQPPEPTFRLGASYVRVDVYPTRNGAGVQDLERGDFELFEDGVPQTIEQFERVSVQNTVDRAARRDPNTVAESQEQAADPRRRVFVVFLDTGMTTIEGSHAARKPIVDMLERLIGDDDLFAVMTPDMRGTDITFARRTDTLAAELTKYWTWGQRDDLVRRDPEEILIETCFPDPAPERYCTGPNGQLIKQPANAYRGVAVQLIERRNERRALTALEELVMALGSIREERKAVIVVSQGWRLLEPKLELTNLQECDIAPMPGTPGVSPGGRLVPEVNVAQAGTGLASNAQCHMLANQYSMVDDPARMRQLIERANRFNVSFYPFDTRGLAAFDKSIGARDDRIRKDPGERQENLRGVSGPLHKDMDRLKSRVDSLKTLAEATDGLAVVNSNDLAGGARRIVSDLSTYYLIGYQSTNTALDGKWRDITVKVKTPGVRVRARKGYRALTEEEVALLRRGEAPPVAAVSAAAGGPAGGATLATAVANAIAPLAGLERSLPWRSRAAWRGGPAPSSTRVWVASDLAEETLRQPEWAGGGTLTAALVLADGRQLTDTTLTVAPGARAIDTMLEAALPKAAEVLIRLRLSPAGGGLPLSETIRVTPFGPVGRLFRRGPTTGRQFVGVGDQRFRRNELARVAVPIEDASATVEATLLDRSGTALKVPVTARVETVDGSAWAQGDAALAALSAGDYAMRIVVTRGGDTATTLTAFRIVN